MLKKEPIFELIHSLSASEKGYFKKNSPASDNIYVKLFDLINGQENYDENKLLKAIKNESASKNFSVTKRYLYDAILASLVSYQSQKNVESQLNNEIESIRILYNKGLYDQCEKMLHKSKETARSFELYHHLLQLLAFEYSFNQFKMRDCKPLFTEEAEVLTKLSGITSINKWYSDIMMWVQVNDKAKNEKDLEEITRLFHQNSPKELNSFKATNTFYAANTFYNYSIGDLTAATNAKVDQLHAYISNPKLREVNYKTFLLVYGNVLSLLYNSGDIERFRQYYEKFAEHRSVSKGQLILEKEIEFAHGVGLFKLTHDYKGGIAFIQDIEAELEILKHKISHIRITDIYFNAAVMFFSTGDLRSALKWLNRIFTHNKVETRQFMYCYAKIFELVIHVELNNTQLLLSLSKSTFRYLYQRNKVHDFENVILLFLKKLIRSSEEQQTSIFNDLKFELKKIAEDPIRSKAMDHFDYISWLEKKLAQ